MDKTPTNTTVWIVEQNPLAAEYVIDVLGKDRTIQPRWMQQALPRKQEIGPYPVFVLDRVGFEPVLADCLRNFSVQFEHPRYIVLDKKFDIPGVLELLSLGVQGFLRHDEVADSLKRAIRYVANGRMWIDPVLMQECVNPSPRVRQTRAGLGEDGITHREAQILELARQRLSNKEIAARLNIEVSTVKFHLSNIFSKLQIGSRSDLWKGPSFQMVTQEWTGSATHAL